jgi:hypothetical protein
MREFTMTAEPTGRTIRPLDRWEADGWTVTLTYNGRSMTIPFYMGTGHNGEPPTLNDVLECLASDAAICEEDQWDDLVDGLPFKQAQQMVKETEKQTRNLQYLLGDDYEEFWTKQWA